MIVVFLSVGAFAQFQNNILPGPKPPDVPQEWKSWIGEYGGKEEAFTVGESGGRVFIIFKTSTTICKTKYYYNNTKYLK